MAPGGRQEDNTMVLGGRVCDSSRVGHRSRPGLTGTLWSGAVLRVSCGWTSDLASPHGLRYSAGYSVGGVHGSSEGADVGVCPMQSRA